MSPVPDCQDCGACCFSPAARYVPVTGADHARLRADEQARFTRFEGHRCSMRMVGGRCGALEVRGGRFVCAVYERRPQVCRDYARGGPACAADREARAEAAGALAGARSARPGA